MRRLDTALHVADRGIGVATGGADDGGVRLIILTDDADPKSATERARRALAQAGAPEATVVEVVRRRLSPGRPRRVEAPSDLSYRTLDLPNGRTLRAAREGTMGDWVIAVGDRDDAWRGRSLFGRAVRGPGAAVRTRRRLGRGRHLPARRSQDRRRHPIRVRLLRQADARRAAAAARARLPGRRQQREPAAGARCVQIVRNRMTLRALLQLLCERAGVGDDPALAVPEGEALAAAVGALEDRDEVVEGDRVDGVAGVGAALCVLK